MKRGARAFVSIFAKNLKETLLAAGCIKKSAKVARLQELSITYRFFGLDFPNREAADLALAENRTTKETWQSIIYAIETGRTPPQNTPLGGHLGIHGLGRADQQVHGLYNWTNGCIALTNAQIDQLSKWLKPGVTVEIW